MRNPFPDWRWRAVCSAVEVTEPPEDALLRDVYNVILGESKHETIMYVLELYHTHKSRDTLVAFFLSGAELPQIMQGTGVDADALRMFEQLFIDSTVFRNKMEWRAYAEYYVDQCCADENGQLQVKKGHLDGPITLMAHWAKGNEVITLTDQQILTQQALMAHTKALAARNAGITDIEAKEAYRWGQFAVNTAQRRSNLQDTADVEMDAIVAIQKRKATLEAEEAGLSLSEILH